MKHTILIGLLALAGCQQPWQARGPHGPTGAIIESEAIYPWTARSKLLCGAMVGLHWADYETSRRLNFGEPTGTGGTFRETNPLLGDYPSDSELALFKGGVVLATVLLAELAPEHRDLIFFCSGLSGGLAAGGNLRLYEQHK